jgi:hypothetical protein
MPQEIAAALLVGLMMVGANKFLDRRIDQVLDAEKRLVMPQYRMTTRDR